MVPDPFRKVWTPIVRHIVEGLTTRLRLSKILRNLKIFFDAMFDFVLRYLVVSNLQAWQGMASDHTCVPQDVPKINLGVLLSHTLDIRIACLVLIFNLVLILHFPPKKSVLL